MILKFIFFLKFIAIVMQIPVSMFCYGTFFLTLELNQRFWTDSSSIKTVQVLADLIFPKTLLDDTTFLFNIPSILDAAPVVTQSRIHRKSPISLLSIAKCRARLRSKLSLGWQQKLIRISDYSFHIAWRYTYNFWKNTWWDSKQHPSYLMNKNV